jgi:hypothetical protein
MAGVEARVIVGIVALACVSTSGVIATLANWEMVEKVNEKLPKEDQFEALDWYLPKTQRLDRGYKRLYPGGRLLTKIRVLMALMFACLLFSAWCFRILG